MLWFRTDCLCFATLNVPATASWVKHVNEANLNPHGHSWMALYSLWDKYFMFKNASLKKIKCVVCYPCNWEAEMAMSLANREVYYSERGRNRRRYFMSTSGFHIYVHAHTCTSHLHTKSMQEFCAVMLPNVAWMGPPAPPFLFIHMSPSRRIRKKPSSL